MNCFRLKTVAFNCVKLMHLNYDLSYAIKDFVVVNFKKFTLQIFYYNLRKIISVLYTDMYHVLCYTHYTCMFAKA